MKSPNIVAIIQARMGSTRLKAKVLADIAGHPMLEHVVVRTQKAQHVNRVVVATSSSPLDDPIALFCQEKAIACFRGSENDVLDRYYQAAKHDEADVIVRITADCPLIDPKVIDRVIDTYLLGNHDYVTNTFRYTYPDGLDTEVFSFKALEKAWKEATLPSDREHVTSFIRKTNGFRLHNVENDVDLSSKNLRFTVDEAADLQFVKTVFSKLKAGFDLNDVLGLLEKEPSLLAINTGLIRNEGFYKSLALEPPLPAQERSLRKSAALKDKALPLIPSLTQTFSKGPTQYVQGVAPVFLMRGEGSTVWDVDGNSYIDYPLGLGPVILGHHYPAVTDAVIAQLKEGISFSLPHPLEVELAELLTEIIPCADMVRFGKNGSDATSGAVRAARAFTGRDLIACCGYHGWQDWYIGTTTRNKGIPKAVCDLTIPFQYNNIESLKKIFDQHPGQVAAVIMEPFSVVEPQDGFLEKIKTLAHAEGALLIFDEIVTGFRLALGGAQEYFGVTPDLACFGKAMANGFPISTVVGRKEIMPIFDEIFFSFTFGGETASLAAAIATITEMRAKNVIAHLWEQGQKLKDGYTVLAKYFGIDRYTDCIGLPPRSMITFKDEAGNESLLFRSLFQQECLKRGVLFAGAQNICYSHGTAEIEHTLRTYRAAMEILAKAIQTHTVLEKLEGEPVQPVFRRT